MKYQFICECGEIKEIEKGMTDPFPKVKCKVCKKVMKRDYTGEQKDKATIIPEHMTALHQVKGQSDFKYDTRPSKKKQFY